MSSDYYKTSDLNCAASLVSLGFELISLDKENPRKVGFIFRFDTKIQETIDDYFSDRLEINARTLFDNAKMLKNRIYSD